MPRHHRFLVFAAAAALSFASPPGAAAQGESPQPAAAFSLDFEAAQPGSLPMPLLIPAVVKQGGWSARVVADQSDAKGRYLEISRDARGAPAAPGNVVAMVLAEPYRGRRILLSADLRVRRDNPVASPRAQLWLRADLPGGQTGFLDNSSDRPVTAAEWTRATIICDVPAEAEQLAIGVLVIGATAAFADNIALTILPDEPPPPPPTPLTERAAANIAAFARVGAAIRYFHPSDQAAAIDWDAFTIAAIPRIEAASSDAELAAALREVFLPIAPTAKIGTEPIPEGGPVDPPTGHTGYVAWLHSGFPGDQPSMIYQSKRERWGVATPTPDWFPSPAAAWGAHLAPGVWASIPTVLFHGEVGSLPKDAPPFPLDFAARYNALRESRQRGAAERDARLAAVIECWGVFRHFYPYWPDVPGGSGAWEDALEPTLIRAATDTPLELLSTLRRLTALAHDGHIFVHHPSDRRWFTAPFAVTVVGDAIVVDAADPAADRAPSPGDRLVSVEGVPAEELLAAARAEVSGATPGWIDRRALADLLAFDSARPRPMEFETLTGDRFTLEITPRQARAPLAALRPDPVAEVRPGIWYVDPERLSDPDFAAAVTDLASARAIVFDFRGYPAIAPTFLGHLSDKPVSSAQWHIPVYAHPGATPAHVNQSSWPVMPQEPRLDQPVAFLTDARAISYAETCMGIVEHYKLGRIVGSPTAGTNGNVTGFSLPGGYSVSFTAMNVRKHDGSPHHGVGIVPAHPVSRSREGIAAGRDEVLDAAIKLLEADLAGAP